VWHRSSALQVIDLGRPNINAELRVNLVLILAISEAGGLVFIRWLCAAHVRLKLKSGCHK